MFIEGKDYKVIEQDSAYSMLVEYNHERWLCGSGPDLGLAHPELKGVQFRQDGMTLLKGYEWNGSNFVTDSPECMRASAVHDAWCTATEHGIYENTKTNWDRGADEYAAICIEDGMDKEKADGRRSPLKLMDPTKKDPDLSEKR